MSSVTIREKLYDYIRFADETCMSLPLTQRHEDKLMQASLPLKNKLYTNEKKVKAIYTMVEGEIAKELNLWDDPAFMNELDQRLAEYENGKAKGSTWSEVKAKAKDFKLKI